MLKVMIVGHFGPGALENSYCRAFEALPCQVIRFDMVARINHYCRLGAAGRFFNQFVPVEPWIRKANRELVIQAITHQPHLILTVGHYPFRVGALAQIKTATQAKFVHLWPDQLLNWDDSLTHCLTLFDCVATFSQVTVPIFQQLGAKQVAWVTFAGDPFQHSPIACSPNEQNLFEADVTFIGGWRPEREAALSELGEFRLKIWGPEWGRRCKNNPAILKAWQGRPLYEVEFAKAVGCSKINLNLIDSSVPMAANMRFFELLMAGGLQLSSDCAEMKEIFRHGEHLYYFQSPSQLPALIRQILQQPQQSQQIAHTAHQLILQQHTYTQRAGQILQAVGLN